MMNDEHGFQPDDFHREMSQSISDLLQPQVSDHSAGSAATMLEDNLEAIPLPCVTVEIHSNSDKQPSINSKQDAVLDPTGAEDNQLLLNKPNSERCLQAIVPNCKFCGKVFFTASALRKHCVTHGGERNHICTVCKKGFKRQDHLKAHLSTHLKMKPFVCMKDGCNKSYYYNRSLRRHFKFQHRLRAEQQKVPNENPYLIPSKAQELTVPIPPVKTNSDTMSYLHPGVTSNTMDFQDPNVNYVPQTLTINISNPNEGFIHTYTLTNSTSKVSIDPDSHSNPPPDNPLWYSNLPSDNSLWNCPLTQSQKIQSMQHQPNMHSSGFFDDATVNEGNIESLAKQLQSLEHGHLSTLANNGQESRTAQNSFTREPGFTRFIIQPHRSSNFQILNPANIFLPITNSQSHTTTLSHSTISIPQSIPEPDGVRGFGDLQKNPQGVLGLARIIGATENMTSGSQDSQTTVQPGQESQTLISNSKTWLKFGRSRPKSAIDNGELCLNPSSTAPTSQVAPESFSSSNKSQGNERIYRLSATNQEDVQERVLGSWQYKLKPTAQSLDSGRRTTKDTTAGRLVIPVSVPVMKKARQEEDKVNEFKSHLQSHATNSGKKKKTCPKPLYIPPPGQEKYSAFFGCIQSNMHSPDTQLSEYLHNGALQCQYTPPPMLSPIRQEEETAGIHPRIDNSGFSVQPHINIGDQFQAVIPKCRDRSELEAEEEKDNLVWRPCLDTEALSRFLNLACSSAVPGGGCNLELGLHCLDFSQGNVLEALDKLLVKEHQERLPPCLADYHYSGSDRWSPSEKCQFTNAYQEQRKNLSFIQSMIPGKSIYQCVEYYYTWKKIKNFEKCQSPSPEHALHTEQSFEEESRCKKSSTYKWKGQSELKCKKQKIQTENKKTLCSQKKTRDWHEPMKFPCQECNRVFDKYTSRNAHMKKHRRLERKRAFIMESSNQPAVQMTP